MLPRFFKILFAVVLLLLVGERSVAQNPLDKDLIQFSGVVVAADSLIPLPFTNIIIKNSHRGTISDYYGYFSFVAEKNDTIEFSSIGFKKVEYVIPDSLKSNRYSLIQVMDTDTIFLREAVIYPWPTKEQFRAAFMALELPEDPANIARRNLDRAEMKERAEALTMDGSMNFRYAMQQHRAQLYHAGQLPPNNLLNPLAWVKFIKAWKNGDFKRKKKK
ncbi:MAG: hypothetical protein ACI85F_000663 [Bacteroidia bacterium]|jgi:hypothetical protein